jgi:hypothetical protein
MGLIMIRVRVELVPFGEESKGQEIAQMIIANDDTGNSKTGNYGFVYSDKFDFEEGALFDFPRNTGIWELISRCLNSSDTHTDDEFMQKLWERLK